MATSTLPNGKSESYLGLQVGRWHFASIGVTTSRYMDVETALSALSTETLNHEPPLVSICVPTFNRRDRLERAVLSALDQDHTNLEVIVSDNASTDSTEEYCEVLVTQDSRVKYVRNPVNIGPTANFNQVRSLSSGAYVMWLGDDDLIDRGYVSACLQEFTADPYLTLVTGEVRYVSDGAYTHSGRVVELLEADRHQRVRNYYEQVSDNGTFYGLSPRWAVDQLGPMRSQMGNDWFLLAELAYLGTFRTARGVAIHRDTGGATRSLRDVARSAGFSKFEAEAPQLAISCNAGWHILRSAVFAELRWRRIGLAGQVTWSLLRRLMPEASRKLRARLRTNSAEQ